MTSPKHIIALHGAGMTASVWDALSAKIKSPCEALSLPSLPSIEKMADALAAQLKDRAPRSAILMGHSMGALIALQSAQHPAVAGLVLIGCAAQMPVHPDLLKQAQATPDAAAGLILKWGVSSSQPPEVQQAVKQHMQAATLFNDLSACNDYKQGATAAPAVSVPTLVLSGSDDKLTRAEAGKALAGLIPKARFHQVNGSGHMLMIENPVEIAKEINAFISTINN